MILAFSGAFSSSRSASTSVFSILGIKLFDASSSFVAASIGTSYELLEWVMEEGLEMPDKELSRNQKEAVAIFKKFHEQNKHKMSDIPTFTLKENQ